MRKHGLTFRQSEVTRIMSCWAAGDSCSLVGVGSVGKTNLLHHLTDMDVQAHYMQLDDQAKFRAINIDPNMLGPIPEGSEGQSIRLWAGYELLMHRLFLSFYPFDEFGAAEAKEFYSIYQELQDGTNPLFAYMGLRYFELGVQFFLRRGYRLVFLFDEFEEMIANLHVKFFQTLRGLRDQHKGQLSYMTFTRAPMEVVVERYQVSPLAFEPFKELFNDNVVYVGPYSQEDTRNLLLELAHKYDVELSDAVVEYFWGLGGGFAGLTRALFGAAFAAGFVVGDVSWCEKFESELRFRSGVIAECQTIWESLSPAEQFVLSRIGQGAPYSVDHVSEIAVGLLMQKRIVRLNRQMRRLVVVARSFEQYLLLNSN